MNSPFLEDQALMERIARGDAGAFRELSQQYLRPLVTFCSRMLKSHAEAEEVTQEVFLRAWQKADRYEPKARVSTWLYTIARRMCIDRLRQKGTRGEEFLFDDERDAAPSSAHPSHLMAQKQEATLIKDALLSLPERQRTALSLCHEAGLSGGEIAVVMEITVEAVESLLSRGRRTLREKLQPTSD